MPVAVAVLVALLALVFVLGRTQAGDGSPPALERVAVAGSLDMRVPGNWQLAGEPVVVPGLELRKPISLTGSPRFAGSGVNAGMSTTAVDPTLLPDGLLRRLPSKPRATDAVRLGGLEGYRYRDLAPDGLDGRATVYVAPTTQGVATVACIGPGASSEEFLEQCESAAASLALSAGRGFELGRDQAYEDRLRRTFRRLNSSVEVGRRKLGAAQTAAGQGTAAEGVARAYRQAERSLKGATQNPLVLETNQALVAQLRRLARAYERLAAPTGSGSRPDYAAAGRAVRAEEEALRELAG